MRKWPAVPVASALASCQVPASETAPPDAAAIQSAGRFKVARTVPLSAELQFAGTAPERIFITAEAPTWDSIWFARELRRLVLN
jgi:hypothetical protein